MFLAGIQKKTWMPAFAGMTAECRTPISVELYLAIGLGLVEHKVKKYKTIWPPHHATIKNPLFGPTKKGDCGFDLASPLVTGERVLMSWVCGDGYST